MSKDFIEIGLPSFSSEELEKIAEKLYARLFHYLSAENLDVLLSNYVIAVNLDQDEQNQLTLDLDIESSGALSEEKLESVHEQLFELLVSWLEEELRCYKRSKA